ncbi:carbamoyltransferase HypF [Plasticicumulans acidivorans]|uniref:Carbamoyltransferase HypF n=1 Tax=Plasticicumulans acidivorans TaxID=886464 RepID=A0A317N026_9GAMM|nr:carbamoyltransferase HypF [Plasticicumulans acidivorans]PWV64726.1 hydrogenase maturation carbamoyltransferase HypF [Plasticicumulans acidivorans]
MKSLAEPVAPLPPADARASESARWRLRLRGQVQGVGMRPFVWRLAQRHGLDGWVGNDGDGVLIEVQGTRAALAAFRAELRTPPPLARIERVECSEQPLQAAARGFAIVASRVGAAHTGIAADVAVCADCLAELFDPAARRWRYPFINCSHCGPRFSIVARLPYDRANTALAAFPPCAECAAEYADPADRRFHAEPLACGQCGPRLLWRARAAELGAPLADVLAETLALLRGGRIVAIKGVGGFQLLCDARNAAAVAELRRRKQRPAKPFALLAANAASFAGLVELDVASQQLLEAPSRPIVLCRQRAGVELAGIAPGLDRLGCLLPAAPLHWLLFHEAAGRPAGMAWTTQPQPLLLVCTSANASGEPLPIDDAEAVTALAGIADAVLGSDRAILARCDDSVVLAHGGGFSCVRRARGWAPQPLRLPRAGPATLAFGADLKNSIGISRGDRAWLSQHIGDLGSVAARRAQWQALEHLLAVLDVQPARVVCDRHPDFASSRAAAEFAAAHGLPVYAVQHHHAHIAAVLAEHGHDGPALGLALDGFGLGDDGAAWGGELLRVEGVHCQRLGHLRPLPLPGGDAAAREPWRMAAAALHVLGRTDEIAVRFAAQPAARTVAALLARGVHCPPSSSAGRLFDAAAGLLGVCATMSYEGEAAIRLEAAARRHGAAAALAGGWTHAGGVLDLRPLLAWLCARQDVAHAAAVFHATLVAALAEWIEWAVQTSGIRCVAVAGGVCLNRVLLDALHASLETRGLRLLQARELPPNDGGLAFGQLWLGLQQT